MFVVLCVVLSVHFEYLEKNFGVCVVYCVAAVIAIAPFVSHAVYCPSAVFDPCDPLCL